MQAQTESKFSHGGRRIASSRTTTASANCSSGGTKPCLSAAFGLRCDRYWRRRCGCRSRRGSGCQSKNDEFLQVRRS